MRCKIVTAVAVRSARPRRHGDDHNFAGKMYFDFTHIDQKNSDTGKTDKTGTGTDVKRFYFSVSHQFDDIWSANLTTDFNYVPSDGQTNLFVKKAYVQGKFSKAAVLRIGSADMPWIPFVEHQYGFRYVEPTLTDRHHFANSADWGVHLGGKLGSNDMFSYAGGRGERRRLQASGPHQGCGLRGPRGGHAGRRPGGRGRRLCRQEGPGHPDHARDEHGFARRSAGGLRQQALPCRRRVLQRQELEQRVTTANDKADGFSVWASAGLART